MFYNERGLIGLNEMKRGANAPYYAVIFSSRRTEGDNGYGAMADEMVRMASEQPGFIALRASGTLPGTASRFPIGRA